MTQPQTAQSLSRPKKIRNGVGILIGAIFVVIGAVHLHSPFGLLIGPFGLVFGTPAFLVAGFIIAGVSIKSASAQLPKAAHSWISVGSAFVFISEMIVAFSVGDFFLYIVQRDQPISYLFTPINLILTMVSILIGPTLIAIGVYRKASYSIGKTLILWFAVLMIILAGIIATASYLSVSDVPLSA